MTTPPTTTATIVQTSNGLSRITRGRAFKPLRVVVYGPDGVGKTAFACGARPPLYNKGSEDVILIPTEAGADAIDVARYPRPETWDDVMGALTELLTAPHQFKKVVIDSLDWLEALAREHVCRKHKKSNLEEFGYGKGYSLVFDEMRAAVMRLEQLREQRSMHVIGVAHAVIRNFKNPEGDNFDRYELKLQATQNASVAGLCREWPDYVLFANWENLTNKDSRTGAIKAVAAAGDRYLNTQRSASFDAKTRVQLPPRLPLDWGTFAVAVKEAFDSSKEETKQ